MIALSGIFLFITYPIAWIWAIAEDSVFGMIPPSTLPSISVPSEGRNHKNNSNSTFSNNQDNEESTRALPPFDPEPILKVPKRRYEDIITELKKYAVKEQISCPYCGNIPKKPPKRRRTCKVCGNVYYVKTVKNDGQEFKIVFKAEDKEHIDDLLDELYEYTTIYTVQEYLQHQYTNVQVPDEYILQVRELLTARFGFRPSSHDVLWYILNELIAEASQKGDLSKLESLYYIQAKVLYNEGRKEFIEPLREAKKMRLLTIKKQGLSNKVRIDADPCPVCAKHDGRVLTIEQALKEMPIPDPECAHGICYCTYRTHFDR